jgi:lactoylglutathione lyase
MPLEDAMLELFHVGLTVKDLQRSLAFYRDIARMEAGEIFDGQSAEFDTLTNNPGASLRGVHLTAGSFMLQLLEYKAGGGTTLDLHHNNVGSPHLCFYVPDVEAKYAELRGRGDVKITSGIVPIARNMRGLYTEDPDGVPVEFLQRTQ